MDVRREWAPGEMEDAQRIGMVFAMRPWPGYEKAVGIYRQIETDVIARAGIDPFYLLEIKRRIAEWIVRAAHRDDVPFEQFQEAWKGLLALGFTDGYKERHMSCVYGYYCLGNNHYDAGLELLEPLIVKFDAWLQSRVLRKRDRAEHNQELDNLKFLRDGLIAFRAGDAEAKAWLERRKARMAAKETNPDPSDAEPWGPREDLDDVMRPVAKGSPSQSFSEIAHQYRQVETEFLAGLKSGDKFFEREARCHISSAILAQAHKHRQPFEVADELWNEVQKGVFQDLEHRCDATWSYANCCLDHGQSEAGRAAVEPLLVRLHEELASGMDTEMDPDRYPVEIARFENLRNKLESGMRG